jgi:hypothetical protein
MKRIATIAIVAAAVAAPAAGSLQAASAKSSGATAVRAEREVRIVGTVTRLTSAKITVANATRKRTFVIPAGFDLGGVRKGDRVEAEGRRIGGVLTLTRLHREDGAAAGAISSSTREAGDDHGRHGGHGGDDGPGHH